jgi:hypothetical protein
LKIFKYQSINKNSLSGLEQGKLWASKAIHFNDPFEFRLKRSSTPKGLKNLRKENSHLKDLKDEELLNIAILEYEKKISDMGVISFTESPQNILMWSHYAAEHKGICLEFTLNDGQALNDVAIYKVSYERYYPEIDFENIWNINGLAKILLTKSEEWGSEKELRTIRMSGNELYDYPVPLSGIIFGLRTSESEKSMIKEILSDKDINFQQIKLADQEYKLKIMSI